VAYTGRNVSRGSSDGPQGVKRGGWSTVYDSVQRVVVHPWDRLGSDEHTRSFQELVRLTSRCLDATSRAASAWWEADATMADAAGGLVGATMGGTSACQYAGAIAICAMGAPPEPADATTRALQGRGVAPFGSAIATAEEMDRHGTPVGVETVLRSCLAGWVLEEKVAKLLGMLAKSSSWDVGALAGLFGATLSSAVLLGASVPARQRALGIAGSATAGTAAGVRAGLGPLHLGKAAGNGVLAALLATGGYSASEDVFAAPGGLRTVLTHHVDPDAAEMSEAFPRWPRVGAAGSRILETGTQRAGTARGMRERRGAVGSDREGRAEVLEALGGSDGAPRGSDGMGEVLRLLRTQLWRSSASGPCGEDVPL